ncbi:DUF1631 family protein [Actimicrobium antarcticum]|uniref:Thymidine phosphorylase n=1 Tax=Actimicrobium antarcticum TaxID=1051899 RepID=A0ABP7TND4_9BURK
MASNTSPDAASFPPVTHRRRSDVLSTLVPVVIGMVDAQFSAFTEHLSATLMELSESSGDAREANLCFNLANLLTNNRYAFLHIASDRLEQALKQEITLLENGAGQAVSRRAGDMSLVPYAEMDNKVLLGVSARLFDIDNAGQLAALNSRLAILLQRDAINVAQNPFRPEVFLGAVHAAWNEFVPSSESAIAILPLLRPGVFLDLPPIIKALNDTLIARGVLPELIDVYQIRKSGGHPGTASREADQAALKQQLRHLFDAADIGDHQGTSGISGTGGTNITAQPDWSASRVAGDSLLGQLQQHQALPAAQRHPARNQLSRIKADAPAGSLSRTDETTIDLLVQVFDSVFRDQYVPTEIKELISLLQVPVLQEALRDKEFFYSEDHPARKLIDLLTRSGMVWDRAKGADDPLFVTIKNSIERLSENDLPDPGNRFAEATGNLTAYIAHDEATAAGALEAPIHEALQTEKIRSATRSAQQDVAVRINTGEVAPFVEAFLESRWVPVLTLAHSIKNDKPDVLTSAIRTMDDLLWSIKPKITPGHRKELIARLPAILSMLNKWLNIIKWEDADRLQFFADLAECHASIVRAPLELSPERQVEIAVEVARKAAERRIEIKAREQTQAEPEPDQFVDEVEQLRRGAWLEFDQASADPKHVRLAWVSPLRTLYIFSTRERQEAFSMSADDLATAFRAGSAREVHVDGAVQRALANALMHTPAISAPLLAETQASAEDNA